MDQIPTKQDSNRDEKGRFKPGSSGNPYGRPPAGWSWADLLREVGEEIDPTSGKAFKELVTRKLWAECLAGNIVAIKDLMDRMDGRPKQATDLTIKETPSPIFGGKSVKEDE